MADTIKDKKYVAVNHNGTPKLVMLDGKYLQLNYPGGGTGSTPGTGTGTGTTTAAGVPWLTDAYTNLDDFKNNSPENEVVKYNVNADGSNNAKGFVYLIKTTGGIQEFRTWSEIVDYVNGQNLILQEHIQSLENIVANIENTWQSGGTGLAITPKAGSEGTMGTWDLSSLTGDKGAFDFTAGKKIYVHITNDDISTPNMYSKTFELKVDGTFTTETIGSKSFHIKMYSNGKLTIDSMSPSSTTDLAAFKLLELEQGVKSATGFITKDVFEKKLSEKSNIADDIIDMHDKITFEKLGRIIVAKYVNSETGQMVNSVPVKHVPGTKEFEYMIPINVYARLTKASEKFVGTLRQGTSVSYIFHTTGSLHSPISHTVTFTAGSSEGKYTIANNLGLDKLIFTGSGGVTVTVDNQAPVTSKEMLKTTLFQGGNIPSVGIKFVDNHEITIDTPKPMLDIEYDSHVGYAFQRGIKAGKAVYDWLNEAKADKTELEKVAKEGLASWKDFMEYHDDGAQTEVWYREQSTNNVRIKVPVTKSMSASKVLLTWNDNVDILGRLVVEGTSFGAIGYLTGTTITTYINPVHANKKIEIQLDKGQTYSVSKVDGKLVFETDGTLLVDTIPVPHINGKASATLDPNDYLQQGKMKASLLLPVATVTNLDKLYELVYDGHLQTISNFLSQQIENSINRKIDDVYTKAESDDRYVLKTLTVTPSGSQQGAQDSHGNALAYKFIVLADTPFQNVKVGDRVRIDLKKAITDIIGASGAPTGTIGDDDRLLIGAAHVVIPNSIGTAALHWKTKTNASDSNIEENYATKLLVLEKHSDTEYRVVDWETPLATAADLTNQISGINAAINEKAAKDLNNVDKATLITKLGYTEANLDNTKIDHGIYALDSNLKALEKVSVNDFSSLNPALTGGK